ncbi:GNAT family N-acetyltransferase [Marinactinospora endophytica]
MTTDIDFVDVAPADGRLTTDLLPVLRQLRPHLTGDLLVGVYSEGYGQELRFTGAYLDGVCVGVAGWRVMDTTAALRKLYVDDLVTADTARSTGVGHRLLAHLEERARDLGCRVLDLDSGVQRHQAHRFYLRERMDITAHHFAKDLS